MLKWIVACVLALAPLAAQNLSFWVANHNSQWIAHSGNAALAPASGPNVQVWIYDRSTAAKKYRVTITSGTERHEQEVTRDGPVTLYSLPLDLPNPLKVRVDAISETAEGALP